MCGFVGGERCEFSCSLRYEEEGECEGGIGQGEHGERRGSFGMQVGLRRQ